MERMADGLPAQQKKSDVDDLYLDMNGIIHMCTHGNDPEIAETSARDQLVRIFAFTDKVCKIVAPKRTIVLAVDGGIDHALAAAHPPRCARSPTREGSARRRGPVARAFYAQGVPRCS